jgi:hypothetical protein
MAQASKPFAPYDCRPEAELIQLAEKQWRTRQALRQLDSILHSHLVAALEEAAPIWVLTEDTSSGWKYWSLTENFAFGKDRGNIPMITALEALHPYFRDKVIALLAKARTAGIELAVVETYRTRAKQTEYKTMGRKYTRNGAGASKHQYGLAVDVVPLVEGKPQWHNRALWYKVGVMGERLGLRWGGRWRHPYDPGHFEWTGGLSTTDLQNGKMPEIPNAEKNYPCLAHDLEQLKYYWKKWEDLQADYLTGQLPLITNHRSDRSVNSERPTPEGTKGNR